MDTVGRRRFLMATASLLLTTEAVPVEPPKVWRIGYVHLRSGPSERDEAFREQLRKLGYVEGQNLVIFDRWTSGATDRLPEITAEYARLNVDAIVASSVSATDAVRRATTSIPVVMSGVPDPVGNGLVQTLSRPGANITGLSTTVLDLTGKRMELLHDLLPNATRVGVLIERTYTPSLETAHEAAVKLKFELVVEYAKTATNFQAAIEAINRRGAQGLMILRSGPGAIDNRKLIVSIVARERLPAIYDIQEFVNSGGLMSYGYNAAELYRRAANYLDRIFKGARPAELPVEQPTTFELVINSRAAAEIGLKIPQSFLARADRVIEG